MNLRYVEYFLAVVAHGGVAKAAEACFVAQPSVSQAIRRLSDDLGAELFTRVGRNLQLTPAGEAFLASAQELMGEIADARTKMTGVRRGEWGRLNLAASGILAIDPLVAILADFFEEHPRTTVSIGEPGEDAEVANAVRRGEVELGLMARSPQIEGLRTFELGPQRYVLVGAPHLFQGFDSVIDLAGRGEIALVGESADRRRIPEESTVLRMRIECSQRLATWQLVGAGAGVALMPAGLGPRFIEGVEERATLQVISDDILLVSRDPELSAPAETLVSIAQHQQRAKRRL